MDKKKNGWSLLNRKTNQYYAKGISSGQKCKVIARKEIKNMMVIDGNLEFLIKDPQGNDWMFSNPCSFQRIKWNYC